MAMIVTPTAPAEEACPKTAERGPDVFSMGFDCVYLTSSTGEAQQTAALLKPARIRIHHAVSLEDAKAKLRITRSRVLMTNAAFRGGTWLDALPVAARRHPTVAVIVASRAIDDRLWISILERGAYDLVQKPFRADELRCILGNAYGWSISGGALYASA